LPALILWSLGASLLRFGLLRFGTPLFTARLVASAIALFVAPFTALLVAASVPVAVAIIAAATPVSASLGVSLRPISGRGRRGGDRCRLGL
jgi:uncharacterized membrane protein YjjP (DUF1212 family)